MNLRISESGLRFRISPREFDTLMSRGALQDIVHLPHGEAITLAVEVTDAAAGAGHADPRMFRVSVPRRVLALAISAGHGKDPIFSVPLARGEGGVLAIALEVDLHARPT